MNDQQRAAMQMALEALEVSTDWDVGARGKQLQSMKAITALREALQEHALQTLSDIHQQIEQPQENTARCGGCNKTAKDGWALYCVECWEKTQPQDTECPCGSECEKCSARCLPQESFSDCIWYTYIDFNEKPPYFRYDTGDNTAKENESTYYEIQEELKQFGYTIEDVYIDHDTICGDIVSINKALAQPQDNLNCKSVQKRLATSWGYVKAQQQVEPVAWIHRYKTGAEQINTAPPETYVGWTHTPLYTTPPSVEAAIEAEREACAKVCDDLHHWAASCCAKDIRARGEK